MNWPQIVVIVLMGLNVGANIALDGKPKTGTYSIGMAIFNAALLSTLLYFGGFWE